MYMFIWVMFLVAGMSFGGAWAAYKNDSKFWTFAAALVGIAAFAAAVVWMIGEMAL